MKLTQFEDGQLTVLNRIYFELLITLLMKEKVAAISGKSWAEVWIAQHKDRSDDEIHVDVDLRVFHRTYLRIVLSSISELQRLKLLRARLELR